MILVTLGTQDKPFTRLLEKIDELIEKKIIKDKVIVQAGHTKYSSSNMEILITHAGVGTIFDALKKDKKIIAIPRMSKYKEHGNDHQLQIVEEFSKLGFIIPVYEMDELEQSLKKVKKFIPAKYESNNKNMINLISKYINKTTKRSVVNKLGDLISKYKEIIMYLIFGVLTTIVSLVVYYGLVYTILNPDNALQLQIANVISWVISVTFAYITNRSLVFESKNKNKIKEASSFVLARVVTLVMDMLIMFIGVTLLSGNDKIMKLISQVIIIVANYIFSKIFVFKK